MKDFDNWIKHKKNINQASGKLYTVRDIWWCALGVNVGFEQDGTGKVFERPVLVLRGFSKSVCMVVPLTTSTKANKYHVSIGPVNGKPAAAIISQVRLVDTKLLIRSACSTSIPLMKLKTLSKIYFDSVFNLFSHSEWARPKPFVPIYYYPQLYIVKFTISKNSV